MKIEDITAVIRPRAPWEAVDLGFVLTRQHLPKLLGLWLGLIVPWWLLCMAVFGASWWTFFLIWFLKPAYDWLAVFYLGRALFGTKPGWQEVIRGTPLPLLRNALDIMLLRRLSTGRALLLPVRVLEGQTGSAYGKRSRVISSHGGGTALSLMACCGIFEVLGTCGVAALVYGFLPDLMKPELAEVGEMILGDELQDPTSLLRWILLLSYLVAMPFIELFYVGGGFGLYLNTRTHMEGWDIDLTFRSIADRLDIQGAKDAKPDLSGVSLPVWFLAALSLGLSGASARTAESGSPSVNLPDAKREAAVIEPGKTPGDTMDKVLAHEDFKVHKKKIRVYRQNAPQVPVVGTLFGHLFQVLVWILVVALVAGAIYWVVRHAYLFNRGVGGKPSSHLVRRAAVVMGMDIRPEALPSDIPRAARKLWSEGLGREALGLLYRGAISRLVAEVRLPIEESDTEGDCLIRARQAGEEARPDYLSELTTVWTQAAYGGTLPREDHMLRLCEAWPFFQTGVIAKPKGGAS
ncbi:MAG: DUF4129 domain-containing protein [Verrucomicrobiales bacterium]|nr:DUF4129 domain-containing protein [Verrucomicrobiae bacterium]